MAQKRWLVLAVVSSALFLIVMDMTILFTSLPTLTHELSASNSQKLWMVNAYGLVVAGLLPGAGTLGDRLGHRKMFLIGLTVFGAASLAAAYSSSPEVLIGARAILAVGAAAMMPATLSIIKITYTDDRERALAIGVWASVASGGSAIGPLVGGLLLEHFWWGSVFLINVPVVALALVMTLLVVNETEERSNRPWDFIGSIQIMVALVAFAYAIKEIAKRDASMTMAVCAFAVAIAASSLFVRRQKTVAFPLIDLTLFRNNSFASGVVTATVICFVLVGVELLMAQRLQLVAGYTPLQSGLFMLPIAAASFLAGPLAGLLLSRIGTRATLASSLAIAGAGVGLMAATYSASSSPFIFGLVIFGFGVGGSISAASTTIMDSAPPERAGMAASIEEVSYELGGAMGVAILGSIAGAAYTALFAPPEGVALPGTAWDSIEEAQMAAQTLPIDLAAGVIAASRTAFDGAFWWMVIVSSALLIGSAMTVWLVMRNARQ
ncbi:MFS transporter [Azorhizobium oxalatiphilum]|uniref:MFS transporter n=1 Tax=Azorhizobium oxalatiphilum TaxID=980631 RepID=A0A917C2R7_9HYPH|nr:MFS transporter [Azorhizobium oxalatiphilum]GGF67892.1 MFS transporter [Azorhizobium oxalatiphilum]